MNKIAIISFLFAFNLSFAEFKSYEKTYQNNNPNIKSVFDDEETAQRKEDNIKRIEVEKQNNLQKQEDKVVEIETNNDRKVKNRQVRQKIKEEKPKEQEPETENAGEDEKSDRELTKEEKKKADLSKIMKISYSRKNFEVDKSFKSISSGHKAMQNGYFEACVQFYESALKVKKNNKDIYFGLGVCYHKLKQYNLAFRNYSDALKIDSGNQKIITNIISILSSVDINSASEKIKPLHQSNPDRYDISGLMGVIYARSGYYEEAAALLSKTVKLSPKDASFNYNLAVVYDKLEDYKKAVFYYKQTLINQTSNASIDYEDVRARINVLNKK